MEDRVVPKRVKRDSGAVSRSRILSCPECGEALSAQDIIRHRNSHWGGVKPDPVRYPEAARRWAELTKLAMSK